MITICLLNPPLTVPVDARQISVPPIGLAYLASILRQNPTNAVSILDAVAEGPGHESMAEPGFVRIGLSFDEIQMRLAVESPAVVGVSFVSSDQASNAHEVCARIKALKKERDVDITVVAGGPHVTAFPYDVMADLNVDYAVVGEGEIPFFKLCDALAHFKQPEDIDAVCYRDRMGTIQVSRKLDLVPDLDLIPLPARDLLQMQRYTFGDAYYGNVLKPSATMLLSRGCNHHCVHCQVPRIFGETYRKRSPENILEELVYLKENLDIQEVQLIGDNLFGDREWALKWMKEIAASKLGVRWSTLSGQSLFNMDVEILNAAAESGLRSLMIDFPSGDEEAYRTVYKRPGSIQHAAQLVSAIHNAGIYVGGMFTIGAPGETKATMMRTVNFALGLPLDEIHIRAVTPFPGTPLWDTCAESNLFEKVPNTEDLLLEAGYIKTAQFQSSDVMKLHHMAKTRTETRHFLAQPGKLMPAAMKFMSYGLFHPIGFIVKIYRFVGSYTGTAAPPERTRRRVRMSERATASNRKR